MKKESKVSKKQVFGWSMYDLSDTLFSALFVTVYFPILITLKGGTAFHVGLVMSISMLLAGLLVPFIGAVADVTQRKKLLLFILTVACCVMTLMTGFFSLTAVIFIGMLANLFYHACLDVYDALLVNVSDEKNRGWISGVGTAAGYVGTIISVAVAYTIGALYGYETIAGVRVVFISTALLYFGFSLFTFVLVKEVAKTKINTDHLKQAFIRVLSTIKGIRKYKQVWLFLLASFLFVDGANTAIIFLFLYSKDQLGMTLQQFLPLYVIMSVSAIVGSVVFGKITDRVGHKKTMLTVLILWVVIILMLYLKTTFSTFIITGIVGGALLGAIWTITRPLMISLAPKDKIAELLGYQGLTEKFSGVIGPFLYGLVAVTFGFRQALLIVIALFLLGAAVLWFVKQ